MSVASIHKNGVTLFSTDDRHHNNPWFQLCTGFVSLQSDTEEGFWGYDRYIVLLRESRTAPSLDPFPSNNGQ